MKHIRRQCGRALLITPEREILLIKIHNPDGDWTGWITPGGGIDEGENFESALRRELFEELSLEKFSLGPAVWRRVHTFLWKGNSVEQDETFFWIPVERFVPDNRNLQDTEMLDFLEVRWWNIDEIGSSSDIFAPRRLFAGLKKLLDEGIPRMPLDIGD